MNIFNFKRFRKKDSYSIISHNTIAELERFKENIKNCNYQILDEEATTKSKLFEYYNQYLDTIYMPLRNVLNCSVFTVDNEIRAMFGHVLDSISDDEGDYNIQKAHGHLRRAIIDVFKITCNNIDLFYNDWLKRYYKYDFRNTHSEFLREFSQRYYTAKINIKRLKIANALAVIKFIKITFWEIMPMLLIHILKCYYIMPKTKKA